MAVYDLSSGGEIARRVKAIALNDPDTDEVNFSHFSGGYIASAAGGTYTVYASDAFSGEQPVPGGNYQPAVDHEGGPLVIVVAAGGRTTLPPNMFGLGWVGFKGGPPCTLFLKT